MIKTEDEKHISFVLQACKDEILKMLKIKFNPYVIVKFYLNNIKYIIIKLLDSNKKLY